MTNQLTIFSVSADRTHECPTCNGSGVMFDADYRRMIEDRPGAVGANHPETSQRAARRPSNVVRFGTQRWRVLEALAAGPMTAAELAARVGLSRNQTATRLGECRDANLVAYLRDDKGEFVLRPTGPRDLGIVQEITLTGLAALRGLTS